MKEVQAFRERALNPEHPVTRGTAENDELLFTKLEKLKIKFL